jgi:alpha-tubulin suppressor-like RCC1 family protein
MRTHSVFWSGALLMLVVGCGREDESPTGPAASVPEPALAEAAAGALVFYQLSSDAGHTCGVTTDNLAYCWGDNIVGGLGDGTTTERLTPVAVAGGHRFYQVSAGASGTCAVTTGHLAYCWGQGVGGALGNGTNAMRLTPTRVAGGLQFLQVAMGEFHT